MPAHEPTTRRRLLQLAAAGTGALWLPRSAWSQPRLADNPFTLGVASGSPAADSVVLWTRLHSAGFFGRSSLPDAPITVRWEVAHDEAFKRMATQGTAQAVPALAHSVHVEAGGLDSARGYFYRFMVGGAGNEWVSPIGRTRTLPAADATPARLRLAYASCQRWEHGHYAAWRHLVDDAPDAVAFLGDYIYEYNGAANAVRSHTDGWTVTLADYRKRYALHQSDTALQAAHAACPWFVVWDDHEVQNDYAGLTPGDAGPAVPDFAARRAAAYQAFYEHMPLRSSVLTRAMAGLSSGADLRIHGQARFGRLATLNLLDARQYKSPLVCTRDGKLGSSWVNPANCPAWNDPARTMLGAAQEQWLEQALRNGGNGSSGSSGSSGSNGSWNLIAQASVFGPRDFKAGPGQSLWNDGWDGYGPARQRLIDTLRREHVANPVLLGGDVHENWVGHVKADYADAASANVGVEFCGTSITSRSAGNAKTVEQLAENPHFVYADRERKGYGLIDLTPERMDVTLRVVSDVTKADAGVETLASFSVADGKAVVERR